MNSLVPLLASLVVSFVDKVPTDNEIGAGWGYLVLFVLLAAAVTFLGFSLAKHLRKARDNAESGVFDKNDQG